VETRGVSVHHARGAATHPDLRLEPTNLITLCDKHHKMADAGIIPLHVILRVIEEQEKKNESPPAL
ncbi:MAG: hypothetical protein WAY93_05630, partial [Atopobiaceae bacterium]